MTDSTSSSDPALRFNNLGQDPSDLAPASSEPDDLCDPASDLAEEARISAWLDGARTAVSILDPVVIKVGWTTLQVDAYDRSLQRIRAMIIHREQALRTSRARRTRAASIRANSLPADNGRSRVPGQA